MTKGSAPAPGVGNFITEKQEVTHSQDIFGARETQQQRGSSRGGGTKRWVAYPATVITPSLKAAYVRASTSKSSLPHFGTQPATQYMTKSRFPHSPPAARTWSGGCCRCRCRCRCRRCCLRLHRRFSLRRDAPGQSPPCHRCRCGDLAAGAEWTAEAGACKPS